MWSLSATTISVPGSIPGFGPEDQLPLSAAFAPAAGPGRVGTLAGRRAGLGPPSAAREETRGARGIRHQNRQALPLRGLGPDHWAENHLNVGPGTIHKLRMD